MNSQNREFVLLDSILQDLDALKEKIEKKRESDRNDERYYINQKSYEKLLDDIQCELKRLLTKIEKFQRSK